MSKATQSLPFQGTKRSQQFVEKYRKKLEDGFDFFNPDTSMMPVEKFNTSKLKMLLIFPTPKEVKTVSSTAAAINDYVIEHCPDVFLDFSFMPEGSDIKLYDDNHMPYAIGYITHLDASYFDVVGFSISVLHEIITGPVILRSFDRCDTPIPLFWSDRKDMKIGETPLIYAGGITAACGDVMFGKVGDKESFMDFLYLGACDKTDIILNRYIQARDNHLVIRKQEDHDIGGYPHHDEPNFIEEIKVETIQDYIESLFDLNMVYQPQAYKVVYNKHNQIIENTKINPKARDFVTPCYPHVLAEDLGIARAIINGDGNNCGTSQVQVSEGCSSAGCCSFCAEGNYCGGHVEKTRERILWECHESKKYSAGYKFKPYSFNVNYLTDYKGMLKEFIQIFPKVTFINMRLEELGRDMDAIVMMKQIGSNRISAPIEGISPRIQNNLLNKCLSRESLDNFMTDLIHMKMTDIKVGGIFTGYETDEDFQWLCDYVHSFKMKAKETGGNLPWRLKVTPLVHYPLTPCEYLERKSAKKSYLGEHWLTDEWYEKFRENEVFFKVNGFRYSTFIEQSIVDLGRSLTPMMYKHFIKDLAPVYSLRSVATAEFIEDLKNFIDPDYFFEARDPEHYISPGHRIHIELMGSYIPRARRLVRAYKAGDIFANDPDIRCLKTYEGVPVKCYSNCIASDPLKIYNDVTLDEEGNLHGEYRELKGCERCQTPEQKKWRLTRPTPQSANSDDIISTPRIPQVQKIRFILNRDSEYDILNPNNTAHTFVTKFLQESDNLLHAFHSIDGHNMFWQSEPAFKYFSSGYQIVDTIWSKDVISEVRSLVDKVNSELKSTKILSVQDIMFDEKLDTKDYNVYVFESTLPREIFAEATLHYKGDIKVDGGMGTLEMSNDKSLGSPVFIQKQGKVVGVFIIPVKYSPVNYLSCFLSSTRKTSFQQVVDTTEFSNQFTVRETSTVCKNCGKEKGLISLITGKYLSFGKNCLVKGILTQICKSE